MKKSINLLVSVILFSSVAIAQKDAVTKAADLIEKQKIDTNKKWDKGGLINVSFSQTAFSNWAAGGQNAMGLTSMASLHANYKNGKFSWLNDAELGYGFQKLDGALLQKTTDQIELTSSVGYKIFDHTSISFLTNFQTQFQPGYTNTGDSVLLSNFMAPAYWILAAGLQYSPCKALNVFISPVTARFVFVENTFLSNEGAFGVDSGKREKTEFGAYLKANFSKDIAKNITLTTNLELFSNYLKDPQNVVINWTTFIQMKVNKFISATLNTQVIYDNNSLVPLYTDIKGVQVLTGKGPRTQFKDVGGIGFAMNL